MTTKKSLFVMTLALATVSGHRLTAQVQTEVPPAIPGAKPVAVERIKIHGAALDNNLEGDAVDRDVIVFLPPSYATQKTRRYPVVYALHGYSIGAQQWSGEISRSPDKPQHRSWSPAAEFCTARHMPL